MGGIVHNIQICCKFFERLIMNPQIKISNSVGKTLGSEFQSRPIAVWPFEDPEKNKIISDQKNEYVAIFRFDCSYRGIIIKIF